MLWTVDGISNNLFFIVDVFKKLMVMSTFLKKKSISLQAQNLSACTLSLGCRPLRFPNGTSLCLTRKYHYYLAFKVAAWTQNKQDKAQYTRHHAKTRLCSLDKSYLDVCTRPHLALYLLALKTLETLCSPESLPNYVQFSFQMMWLPIWGYVSKQHYGCLFFFKSIWPLIPHHIPLK